MIELKKVNKVWASFGAKNVPRSIVQELNSYLCNTTSGTGPAEDLDDLSSLYSWVLLVMVSECKAVSRMHTADDIL